jgi:hypothetical protein
MTSTHERAAEAEADLDVLVRLLEEKGIPLSEGLKSTRFFDWSYDGEEN